MSYKKFKYFYLGLIYLIRDGFIDPRNYMILHKEKLIYINNAKVGCSSISIIFAKKLGFVKSKRDYNLINPKSLNIKYTLNKKENSYYKFSFVRNPFDRLVSCYEDKIMNPFKNGKNNFHFNNYFFFIKPFLIFKPYMKFEDFVKKVSFIPDKFSDRHFCSQYSILYSKKKILVNYIGKFERFNNDYQFLKKKFNLSELPKINSSKKKKDWREYYTLELAEIVYLRYKRDFDLWYPKEYNKLVKYINNKNDRKE